MKKILLMALSAVVLSSCSFYDVKESKISEDPSASTATYYYSEKQDISFTDANEIIYNPDNGFYSCIEAAVTKNGITNVSSIVKKIKATPTLYTGKYDSNSTFNLIHLKMDISAFSSRNSGGKDSNLSDKALTDIEKVLKALDDAEKTAIIRFAYDPGYDGKSSDMEPKDFKYVLNHVKSISSVLKKYPRVLTAIECGMIGPWGEMHGTTYADGKDSDGIHYISKVMKAYLDGLDGVDVPLLVRQPAFIYHYLESYCGVKCPKNGVPSYTPSKNSKEYKLGLYNDGYLGSSSDLGTFKVDRKTEIEFLRPFTNHTPYGGEMCTSSATKENPIGNLSKASWDDVSSSIPEMWDVHLSFLNIAWNNYVMEALHDGYNGKTFKYNGENAFIYILKHMGYRYIVEDAVFNYPKDKSSVNFELKFNNTGFGKLPYHHAKTMRIIIEEKSSNKVVMTKDLSKKFKGDSSLNETIDISSLPKGQYRVFLKICDSDGKYPIQLANGWWSDTHKANRIGSIYK